MSKTQELVSWLAYDYMSEDIMRIITESNNINQIISVSLHLEFRLHTETHTNGHDLALPVFLSIDENLMFLFV